LARSYDSSGPVQSVVPSPFARTAPSTSTGGRRPLGAPRRAVDQRGLVASYVDGASLLSCLALVLLVITGTVPGGHLRLAIYALSFWHYYYYY
jgi:hypothetical protein